MDPSDIGARPIGSDRVDMPDTVTRLPGTKNAGTSQARIDAESVFTPVQTPSSIGSVPVVVVKRRKVVVANESVDGSHDGADEDGAARFPKVYRVEPSMGEELEEALDPGAAIAQGGDTSPVRDAARLNDSGRRRRQKKHGNVTIIKPAPPSSSELAERRRKAMERYELLMTEIRKLDRQAEAVRKVEAAKAVRWIRKAIADYELDADDLGL
jgi:hypothetical protein